MSMPPTDPEKLKAKAIEHEADLFLIKRKGREVAEERIRQSMRPPKLLGFSLEEILQHTFPRRRAILKRDDHVILRAGNIAQVFAYRGYGKTWLLETMALVVAYQIEALGLHAPEPSKVLYVDGEMASEDVKERFQLLCDMLNVPRQLGVGAEKRLVIVGADWQEEYLPRLDTLEGQSAIEPFVDPADFIILDNRSCLFDPEGEKDPSVWQLAQDWLLSLRRRGKTTVMAHHANRQGGARGIGKAEDVIDLNLKLSRPEGYTAEQGARFLVEFDKARGIRGAGAKPFLATLKDKGWHVQSPDAADESSLRLAIFEHIKLTEDLNEPIKTANAVHKEIGGNKSACLRELQALMREELIKKTEAGYVVNKKAQGAKR